MRHSFIKFCVVQTTIQQGLVCSEKYLQRHAFVNLVKNSWTKIKVGLQYVHHKNCCSSMGIFFWTCHRATYTFVVLFILKTHNLWCTKNALVLDYKSIIRFKDLKIILDINLLFLIYNPNCILIFKKIYMIDICWTKKNSKTLILHDIIIIKK